MSQIGYPIRVILAVLLAAGGLAAIGLLVALQPPAVARHRVALPDWPEGTPPVRLALLTDTHVAGPDMPPSRLAAIVTQVNALAPDCVLLGGDYVSDKLVATRRYTTEEAVAPFAGLRPRIATLAVAGNHDEDAWGRDGPATLAALRRAGAITLANQAARCGPLTVAGVDELYTRRHDLPATLAAARTLGGPMLLLSHSPDIIFDPLARVFPLVVAGHTHCGQIALPGWGPLLTASRVGRRAACGRTGFGGGRTLIVGAGLGTSGLPMRLFTRPEILLIEIGGAAGSRDAARPRRSAP